MSLILLCAIISQFYFATAAPKNVLLILTDDQGLNDVGYNNPEFNTPTIDTLKANGLNLPKYYTSTNCSPARSALLTGLSVQKTGTADGAFLPFSQYDALNSSLKLLPEYLKTLNYRTVGIGKWHLGGTQYSGWPTNRGFDKWFGILGGSADEFTHRIGVGCNNKNPVNPDKFPSIFTSNCYFNNGYDLIDGTEIVTSELNKKEYFLHLLGSRAVDEIVHHDTSKPLFMYLAPSAPHTPLQVPSSYYSRCPTIKTPANSLVTNGSLLICAIMAAVDDLVFNVTQALKQKGMYENTLILYASDNGGVTAVGSNNGRYRGQKATFFEGGIRVPAFISGDPVKTIKGQSFNDLTTITDLTATILAYAGFSDSKVLKKLEGKSLLKNAYNQQWIINDQFSRDVVPISMTGRNAAYSSGIVFKYNGKTWKYTNIPNLLGYLVGYEPTLLNNPYFFDLSGDPYETTNLIDSSDSLIQNAVTYGISLLQKSFTQGLPSFVDTLPGYVINYRPSPLGCWLALDHPKYNVANCGGPTIPLPAQLQPDVVYFPTTAAKIRGGYSFGSPIPQFPRTTRKPSASPTSFSPSSMSPKSSPSPTKLPSLIPLSTKKPTIRPSVTPSWKPSSKKICQYGKSCASTADCIAGNKCTNSQCVPDSSTYSTVSGSLANYAGKCTATSQCADPGAYCDLTSSYPQCHQPLLGSGLCWSSNNFAASI
mmetsp:Transcript_33291/g.48186  ORF Transcript_33291/g.48186 Transcript_33291/m.48186 type:complete len:707 (-) Transcript_33291:479-2599(-)|eukprot:CAMPEP_0170074936 /NCGR_PEP_ID=MMETSP0019_2-20121128/12161_1 /TAXON_ID=98059 /ORGANISM="Dinobryon sp., Strain UTEXLB2267" /LENGTH=706 /DNA_ID=CAMNT_0010285579 /DNA_START=6 /DNA_END=2126 /DNA_ORIENTATION=-